VNYSSITRLTGFASGMDTDSIVKKLMNAESISLNKLKQNQQKQTWLSDTYRQWNADLLAFRSNTLLNMSLSKTYNTFDVTSSQENAVSATASGSSLAGTYSVEVKQLASSASFTGNKVSLDSTKTLGNDVQGTAQLPADTSITLNVNNDPGKTAVINIKTTDTINDVVAKINGAKDSAGKSLGLQAFYDPTLQQFTLKTKETGEAAKIDLSMNTSAESQSFLKNTLGLDTTTLVAAGQNANVIFNGNEITTLTTNNATIMGINFSFKSPTLTAGTVTVSQNTDGVMTNIKDFVEKYNSLLDKMNKTVTEPIYRDYLPLLEEQRSEMSEKQIEMWEGKAKSGLLRSDSILTEVINKVRGVVTSIVDNGSSYNSLAAIGISTRSYQDKGKLYVDDSKLRVAIQEDPAAVEKLFSQLGDPSKGTSGVINQLSEVLQGGIKELTNKAGYIGNNQYDQSVIGKLLSNTQTDISQQTEKLVRKEAQYYRQFAAMEQAISRFNSQSSWLYQQMGGGM
jgi:flagellar hook-associated protein 2